MPRPTQEIHYEQFLGLNDGEPTEIRDFQASVFQNLYIMTDAQELVRRGGTSPLDDALSPDVNFDLLHWVSISGTAYLVVVHDTHVKNLLADAPHFIVGGFGRLSVGRDSNTAFVNNTLIIGDGTSQNVRFNGTNVRQVMPSQPASGTNLAGTGSGSFSGTYSYRITFLSFDGNHSQPSVATSGITVTSVSGITLSSLPIAPAGEDCVGRGIWRNLDGGGVYYLVGTINDNTATTFMDDVLDDDVDTTTPLDTFAVRFPPCQVLVNFGERLAGIRCDTSEGDNRTLFVSNYEQPWYCPQISPLDGVDDPTLGARFPLSDAGIGLAALGNVLVVFMRGQAWRLIGNEPNNWDFHKWLDHGCVAHRTIQTYKNLMIWLSGDGVYATEGLGQAIATKRISDDIEDSLNAVPVSGTALAHAFIWDDKYFLCFPSAAFYYDLKYRVWGELTGWAWRDSTVTQNTGSAREVIYAALYGSAQAWELETGTDDDGEEIPVVWASKDRDMKLFGREKRLHRVVIVFKTGTGTATIKLYRGAGELIQTITHDLSTVKRTGAIISILDKRAVPSARDEFFRLRIETDTTSDEFRILRAGMTYTVAT